MKPVTELTTMTSGSAVLCSESMAGWRLHAMRAGASLFLIGGLLCACATLVPKPQPPQVTLEGVRVVRLTPLDTRLSLALLLRNPNTYDLFVNEFIAAMLVDGEPLFTGSLLAPATLPGSGETHVELEVRTDFSAVATALQRFTREGNIPYEISGAAVVQNGLRLPFSRTGEMPSGEFLGQRR